MQPVLSKSGASRLADTATAMVAEDKGLLAMDESTPTCDKRFAALGIPTTVEARRAYREMILTTPSLGESISGVILYDETIRQSTKDSTPLMKLITDAGIIPGIKVDRGQKQMAGHPGEKITEGLDGLHNRLTEYAKIGDRFAKWRRVIAIERRYSQPWLHRGQRTRPGPVRSVMPRGRSSPHCRAGSAYGWVAYVGAVPRGHRGSPANGFQSSLQPTRDVRGHDPEAQHGASRIDMHQAGNGGRGRGRHRQVSLADCPRGRPRDCFPIGRAIRRTCFGSFERHECSI